MHTPKVEYELLKRIDSNFIYLFFSFIHSLIYHIQASFPPFLQATSPTSPLPKIHHSSISFQKRAGLPGILAKPGISSCNKPRYRPLLLRLYNQPDSDCVNSNYTVGFDIKLYKG